MRATLLFPLCILVASCGEEAPTSEQTAIPTADPLEGLGPLPPQAADYPALRSEDCEVVARFYLDAIEAGDFERAALVWDDPVIDEARLKALFATYRLPEFTPGETFEEGATGTLYCTVNAGLTDAADPDRAPRQGTLTLRRANEIPGATAEQSRWTINASTFIEPMERAGRGEPA